MNSSMFSLSVCWLWSPGGPFDSINFQLLNVMCVHPGKAKGGKYPSKQYNKTPNSTSVMTQVMKMLVIAYLCNKMLSITHHYFPSGNLRA